MHLGYDEETSANQGCYAMSIVRHGELWCATRPDRMERFIGGIDQLMDA